MSWYSDCCRTRLQASKHFGLIPDNRKSVTSWLTWYLTINHCRIFIVSFSFQLQFMSWEAVFWTFKLNSSPLTFSYLYVFFSSGGNSKFTSLVFKSGAQSFPSRHSTFLFHSDSWKYLSSCWACFFFYPFIIANVFRVKEDSDSKTMTN